MLKYDIKYTALRCPILAGEGEESSLCKVFYKTEVSQNISP